MCCCDRKKVESHSKGNVCFIVLCYINEYILYSGKYGGRGSGEREERSDTQEGNIMFVVSYCGLKKQV